MKKNVKKIILSIPFFNDYFIQIFIPEELNKKMKKYLNEGDKLGLLKEVLGKKSLIKVIINRDKELANETRKQIISRF